MKCDVSLVPEKEKSEKSENPLGCCNATSGDQQDIRDYRVFSFSEADAAANCGPSEEAAAGATRLLLWVEEAWAVWQTPEAEPLAGQVGCAGSEGEVDAPVESADELSEMYAEAAYRRTEAWRQDIIAIAVTWLGEAAASQWLRAIPPGCTHSVATQSAWPTRTQVEAFWDALRKFRVSRANAPATITPQAPPP
jgi:hypothetical protein